MRRIVVLGAVLLVTGLALLFLFQGAIATRLMERVVTANLAADPIGDLSDGLHVTLCGAGGPLPDPARSGPCVAVVAGERLFIVDAGTGAARNLIGMGRPPGQIAAVFLTHFHSDHIDGLGELALQRWVGAANTHPLPVHGPLGVEVVVEGFDTAYAQDAVYRTAHHGEAVAPRSGAGLAAFPFPLPDVGAERVVLEDDGLRITAFQVEHEPASPAVGYRFDYGGRSLVVSGDTKQSAELERVAKGVDLLVHEALDAKLVGLMNRAASEAGRSNVAKITQDILDYHTTPVQAAESARAAGAGHLLYYHIVPPLPLSALEGVFLEGVSEVYTGGVTLGRDGTTLSLPADSDAIEVN